MSAKRRLAKIRATMEPLDELLMNGYEAQYDEACQKLHILQREAGTMPVQSLMNSCHTKILTWRRYLDHLQEWVSYSRGSMEEDTTGDIMLHDTMLELIQGGNLVGQARGEFALQEMRCEVELDPLMKHIGAVQVEAARTQQALGELTHAFRRHSGSRKRQRDDSMY